MPEAQTFYTPQVGTVFGIPLNKETCLTGFWPSPAPSTLPSIISLIWLGSNFVWFRRALVAKDDN